MFRVELMKSPEVFTAAQALGRYGFLMADMAFLLSTLGLALSGSYGYFLIGLISQPGVQIRFPHFVPIRRVAIYNRPTDCARSQLKKSKNAVTAFLLSTAVVMAYTTNTLIAKFPVHIYH